MTEITFSNFAELAADPVHCAAALCAHSWASTRLTAEHCRETGQELRLPPVPRAEAPAVAAAAAIARAWGLPVFAATDPGGSAPSARFLPAHAAARTPWRALAPAEVVGRLWELCPPPHCMARARFAAIMVGCGAVPLPLVAEFAKKI